MEFGVYVTDLLHFFAFAGAKLPTTIPTTYLPWWHR
jgi:hypothetical protein